MAVTSTSLAVALSKENVKYFHACFSSRSKLEHSMSASFSPAMQARARLCALESTCFTRVCELYVFKDGKGFNTVIDDDQCYIKWRKQKIYTKRRWNGNKIIEMKRTYIKLLLWNLSYFADIPTCFNTTTSTWPEHNWRHQKRNSVQDVCLLSCICQHGSQSSDWIW